MSPQTQQPDERRVIVACVAVAIWLFGYALLHLRTSLPQVYVAAHWRSVWTGLDLLVGVGSLLTCWMVFRRSPFAVIAASSVATALLADAWFDCWTARPEGLTNSLLALAFELPVAAAFFWLARCELRSACGS
jgi:hypothetical protein